MPEQDRIQLPRQVLLATLRQFRACGRLTNECVSYWVASRDHPSVITDVVHPVHSAAPWGYEVDSQWVHEFFLSLRDRRETVICQVHTHPGAAGHSETDDEFALAPSTGFLSLVLPNFAADDDFPGEAHLVGMTATGAWAPRDVEVAFAW